MKSPISVLIFCLFAVSAFAADIIVKADGTGDYPTIQAAIDDAKKGDVIILQPGTYTGAGNKNLDTDGKALTIRSTNPNDPNVVEATVINCQTNGRGFYLHSGENENTIIEGLKITYGYVDNKGAGVYCSNASPTIRNCIIQGCISGNYATALPPYGGGIYCSNSSTLIQNCLIKNCQASGLDEGHAYGGGICCVSDSNLIIEDCNITGNESRGASALWLWHNGWYGYGGGICILSDSSVTLTNTKVLSNSASGGEGYGGMSGGGYRGGHAYGGGLYADSTGNLLINDCNFSNNSADGGYGGYNGSGNGGNGGAGLGGGLYATSLSALNVENCVFLSNKAKGGRGGENESASYNGGNGGNAFGAGLYFNSNGHLELNNITFSGNITTGGNGYSYENGGNGGKAYGGGLANYSHDADIADVNIINNQSNGGNAGHTTDYYGDGGQAFGGGIYTQGSITLTNCLVNQNQCSGGKFGINQGTGNGGGICTASTASLTVLSTEIKLNKATGGSASLRDIAGLYGAESFGGGICFNSSGVLAVNNSDVEENEATGGDGGDSAVYDGGPGGDAYGGGIYCESASQMNLEKLKILTNKTNGGKGGDMELGTYAGQGGFAYGAGILINCPNSISNNTQIQYNMAVGGDSGVYFGAHPNAGDFAGFGGNVYGAGIYDSTGTTFFNCLITDNECVAGIGLIDGNTSGAGIYTTSSSTVNNSDICSNICTNPNGAVGIQSETLVTLMDSILWDNQNDDVNEAAVNITYSCIEEIVSGTGNIHSDPCFVSGPKGDYYLSQLAAGQSVNSPCVDAGSDTAANIGLNLFTTRTDGEHDSGTVDMGYHYIDINAPVLQVLPLNISFQAYLGGTDPNSQYITVKNIGSRPLNWTATPDANWLSVDPNSGICPAYNDSNIVTVSVNIAGLAAGIYDANVVISDPCALDSPQIVIVQLAVVGPVIALSQNEFYFEAAEGGDNPAYQVLGIQNIGGGTLNWQVTDPCDWLRVDPNSGSSTSEVDDVNIIVDISGLTEGSYSCELTVSSDDANNSPQMVLVELDLVTSNIADLNKDLVVDFSDFAILALQFFQTPNIPSADIAPPGGDGFVDYNDLNIFCQNWLDVPVPNEPNIPNLVAHWRFDEGSGDTAYDSAGNNDGTLISDPCWVTGKIGSYALDFDGDDGVYINGSSGHDSPLNIYNTDISISAWVKPYGNGTVVARAKSNYITYRLLITDSGTKAGISYYIGSHVTITTGAILSPGNWYHIVGVFDRSHDIGRVYVDGVEQATGSIPTDPYSCDASTKIGCRKDTADLPFNGIIDDVYIYDRAITEDEVELLYQMGN